MKVVPPNFKVPAPVKIIVALAEPPTISPETERVPVEIVISCLIEVPPLVNAILPAFKVPAPTAIKFTPLLDLGMVIAPATVSVMPVLIVKDVAVVVKVIDAHAASAVTVTLNPPTIDTASAEPGIKVPVGAHVLGSLQFPLFMEVKLAPFVTIAISINPNVSENILDKFDSFIVLNILSS